MRINKVQYSDPVFEKLTGDKWKVAEDFQCDIVLDAVGTLQFNIKKGFVFNFRSGPQFLAMFFPKIGNNWLAYLIHDSIYQKHCLSRSMGDNLLYRLSRFCGHVGYMGSRIIYQGVRICGKEAWKDQDENNIGYIYMTWGDKPRRMQWYKTIKRKY